MTRFENAATTVGALVGFSAISTAAGWCGYTLLCMVGFRGRATVPVMLILGLHPVLVLLLGIVSTDGPPELIRNNALLRRLPRTVHLIITLLAGLVVAVGVMVGIAWCGARLLRAAHFRHELPLSGAFSFSLVVILFLFFGVRSLGHAHDYVSLRRGAGRHADPLAPPAPPPPPDPETLAFQAKHAATLHELRAAIARGVCPACGAGGFSGAETYSHSVDGFARDGRGFVGGAVYEVWGRCPACGHAPKSLVMR
jgi:hypothetical protein